MEEIRFTPILHRAKYRKVLSSSSPTAEALGRALVADYCGVLCGKPVFSQEEFNEIHRKAAMMGVVDQKKIKFFRSVPMATDKIKFFAALTLSEARTSFFETVLSCAINGTLREEDWTRLDAVGDAQVQVIHMECFFVGLGSVIGVPELQGAVYSQMEQLHITEDDLNHFNGVSPREIIDISRCIFRDCTTERIKEWKVMKEAEVQIKEAMARFSKTAASADISAETEIWNIFCDYHKRCQKIEAMDYVLHLGNHADKTRSSIG